MATAVPQGAQVWITQLYLETAFHLRKRSPDGATAGCSGRHLIAAYYTFIDPERMKG